MNLVTALAIVIGVLGGVATWLVLGPLGDMAVPLSIWAVFVGWASFFSAGGGEGGFMSAAICAIWGAAMATVALLLLPLVPAGVPWVAAVVGATVAVMILGAHLPLLSAIPASVYGYASTAAFGLLKQGAVADSVDVATSPFLNVVASMILGAVFGYVSEKIAKALAS
jgi:hypothetical protein